MTIFWDTRARVVWGLQWWCAVFHSLVLLEDEHKIPKKQLRPGYEREKGSRKHRSCQYTISSKGTACHKKFGRFVRRSRKEVFFCLLSNSINERRNYGSRNCKRKLIRLGKRKKLQDLYFIPRKERYQSFIGVEVGERLYSPSLLRTWQLL